MTFSERDAEPPCGGTPAAPEASPKTAMRAAPVRNGVENHASIPLAATMPDMQEVLATARSRRHPVRRSPAQTLIGKFGWRCEDVYRLEASGGLPALKRAVRDEYNQLRGAAA